MRRLLRLLSAALFGLVLLPLGTLLLSLALLNGATRGVEGVTIPLPGRGEGAPAVTLPGLDFTGLLDGSLDPANLSLPSWDTIVSTEPVRRQDPLQEQDLVRKVQAACPTVLTAEECRRVPVKVEPLGTGEAGGAHYTIVTVGGGEGRVRPSYLSISPDLLGENDAYIRHVATHEWVHVKQYLTHPKASSLQAATKAANAYFQRRGGKDLGETGGAELLTDCTTVLGYQVSMGPRRGDLTPYVLTYMPHARTMEEACGPGWRELP